MKMKSGLYLRGKTWWYQIAHNGQIIRESTKETSRVAADRKRSQRLAELTSNRKERERAQKDFGTRSVSQCHECKRWQPSELAITATIDGQQRIFCSAECQRKFEVRITPMPTVAEFMSQTFLTYTETHFASTPKSHLYYKVGAMMLSESDLGQVRIDAITQDDITRFKEHCAKANRKLSTANCGLRTLRRALRYAADGGKLTRVPKISIDATHENKRERVISFAEFAAYYELCRQPWKDIALVLYRTACRPSEIYTLRWEQVDFESGTVKILAGKTDAARREVPMLPEVADVLFARWESQKRPRRGSCFPAESASGHVEQGAAKICHADALRKLAKATAAYAVWEKRGRKGEWFDAVSTATGLPTDYLRRHETAVSDGVEWFAPYSFRHSFLSFMANAGADLFSVAKLAGHASLSITRRYVHGDGSGITRALDRMKAQNFLLPRVSDTKLTQSGRTTGGNGNAALVQSA